MDVYDARGRRLRLRGAGRSGGEGTVYEIEDTPLWVAKIYHPHRVDRELEDKIAVMAAHPPADPAWDGQRHRSIAWVHEVLTFDRARTRFAGFTMPAVDTRRFREAHLYYDPDDRSPAFGGAFTWRHLLVVAANVASSVAAVHAAGHRVGDLRETNVLVSPTALITLIDCDSFTVHDPVSGRTFPTRVGTGEYLPPELQGADFRNDHDRTYADRFALAVLIFKLLMAGVHPFQARGRLVDDAPTPEAKIARGHYPYRRFSPRARPPAYAPPVEVLPPAIRRLLERCFCDGRRRPRARPSPEEWFAVLRAEAKRVRRCDANENHWHGGHLRRCPWCRMAHERGIDVFPAPGVLGRQLTVKAPAPAVAVAGPPATVDTPGVMRRALRRARGLRVTRRRVAIVTTLAALLVALMSPLGHSSEPPSATAMSWHARASGTCPFDPASGATPPSDCTSRWQLGPARRVEHRSRRLFVLRDTTVHVVIEYAVTYRSARACALPWIPNLRFNEAQPPLCLATCPERIELRGRGAPAPLVAATGVGAREGPLRCGEAYRGAWVFDVTDTRGALRLHYPAFDDVALPADVRAPTGR